MTQHIINIVDDTMQWHVTQQVAPDSLEDKTPM